MKITLQQMRVFSAVARHGNLTAAAAALYLTKGAVSQSLQQLESHLDTPLFDRVHPRLQLNQQGKRLLPMADELIERAGEIEHTFGQYADNHCTGDNVNNFAVTARHRNAAQNDAGNDVELEDFTGCGLS